MAFNVVVKIGGKLKRFQEIANAKPKSMDRIFESWTKIITAFIRRRFSRASRGDGTWKPLAPSTIARRRKHSTSILQDTGLLFRQLSPELSSVTPVTKSGQLFQSTVSFGGKATYPNGTTITDVMSFHQTGGGRLPQRKIIVDPDAKTRDQLIRSAQRLITDEINGK